jgi:hypothetical protein
MSVIIYILLAIAVIILLVLLVALVSKKTYSLHREVTINKSTPEVFNYIRLLKNQDHYSKFVMADPNMKKTFKGVDGTETFIYAWDGNKQAGQGEQEITRIVDGKRMDTEVRFFRPFAGVAYANMITEPVQNDQTKVRWTFESEMKYPMNIMLLFMNMEKMLGRDLEESLVLLKRNLEN